MSRLVFAWGVSSIAGSSSRLWPEDGAGDDYQSADEARHLERQSVRVHRSAIDGEYHGRHEDAAECPEDQEEGWSIGTNGDSRVRSRSSQRDRVGGDALRIDARRVDSRTATARTSVNSVVQRERR